MDILTALHSGFLFFDGGTGTVLQSMGLQAGERPEEWNLTHPDKVIRLHSDYLRAGCNILKTNTFGVNRLRFGNDVSKIVTAALANAHNAVRSVEPEQNAFIALDIGPCGKLLKPLGDLDFEDAFSLFAEVIEAGAADADLILIETMNDAAETKAAVLAAKEHSSLPVFVTNVYDESGKTLTGSSPAVMAALLEGLGADAVGMNCSLGPEQMVSLLPELTENCSVPVILNPNAGLPHEDGDKTVYDVSAGEFAAIMTQAAKLGASVLGGCCGTTPDYIRELVKSVSGMPVRFPQKKQRTIVSSHLRTVEIGNPPTIIGERINPTGKKLLKEALRASDDDYILNLALEQEEQGADILDINVGLPELDERAVLTRITEKVQAVTGLPLQLDSSDSGALERAMRRYIGIPLVNSVNGKAESMHAVFPLLKKYGGCVVALTLDDSGIPDTAEGRFRIAESILSEAEKFGISKNRLIFDPLAMAVSADAGAAQVTLDAVGRISSELHCKSSLGVSNVSFGLPRRDSVTASFLSMAMTRGLDAAILNPKSDAVMQAFLSSAALCGKDSDFSRYIAGAGNTAPAPVCSGAELTLSAAVEKGLASASEQAAKSLLSILPPLEIIHSQVIPALDSVGKKFEQKTLFLPQLLLSAEAATAALNVVRAALLRTAEVPQSGRKILLATVRGDIHDIGKNIVKVLLQSYGFEVLDLGRDVPADTVVKAAADHGIRLVGLSALMTTTVPAMEETVALLHSTLPDCRVIVGGAVLTPEYAEKIHADYYAKDAMETVRIAEAVLRD